MAGMPTLQEIEEWIESALQDNVPRNLQELPFKISETIMSYSEAVYNELTRYGNPLNLPSLQQLEDSLPTNPFAPCTVATTPPPPPPPKGLLNHPLNWTRSHRRAILLAGGVAALGLGAKYAYQSGLLWLPLLGKRSKMDIQTAKRDKLRTPQVKNGVRQEAVVVLGADTPLGRAIALHLTSVGFIVIASVSSSAAAASFNSIVPPSSRGYIKTLLFETSDVASSLHKFVRSIDEVLKLRFPLLSAGDPYASPGDEVSLVGVVNALSYLAPTNDVGSQKANVAFQCNPAELAESMEKHVVAALCALSSLSPLLTSPLPRGSLRGSESNVKTSNLPAAATAITLLSSPSSHTSLPGADRESVIAQAAAAGIEVIRREAEERASRESIAGPAASPAPPSRRPLRVTTLEIDEGIPWGYATGLGPADDGSSIVSPTSNTGNNPSTAVTPFPARPAYMRKPSSFVTWPTRDSSTQLVLARVTSLLLTPNPSARLKATYRVYLPTEKNASYWGQVQSLWSRGTQRLMRIIPTAWVDMLLSLRKTVSLRRAGLIGQGPRAGTRPGPQSGGAKDSAQSRSSSLSRSTAGQTTSSNARRTGANASASASSLAPPGSSSRPTRGYYYPTPGSASTSGPPSLPDSNSGESTFHADAEDGMVSSGVLDSHSEPEGDFTESDGGGGRMGNSRRSNATLTALHSSSTDAAGENGPWMGPDEPTVGDDAEGEQETAEYQPCVQHSHDGDHEHGEDDGDQGEGTAFVGESWVALGESSRRERDE